MIQILFRHRIADGTEATFVASWEQLKAKQLSRSRGPVEAAIFRNASDPSEIVTITRWKSLDDWTSYWSEGVPEPEGELQKNEILEEIKSLVRPAAARRNRRNTR